MFNHQGLSHAWNRKGHHTAQASEKMIEIAYQPLLAVLLAITAKYHRDIMLVIAGEFVAYWLCSWLYDGYQLFLSYSLVSALTLGILYAIKSHFEIALLIFISLLYNAAVTVSYFGLAPAALWDYYEYFMGLIVTLALIYMGMAGHGGMLHKNNSGSQRFILGRLRPLFSYRCLL